LGCFGTVLGFRLQVTLEHAIGSHACSLEASILVTNGIPFGCSLLLLVGTVNCVQALKVEETKGGAKDEFDVEDGDGNGDGGSAGDSEGGSEGGSDREGETRTGAGEAKNNDSVSDGPARLKSGAQLRMVQQVLSRSLRLSYHRQIASSIPEKFGALKPAVPGFASVIDRMPASIREAGQCNTMAAYIKEHEPKLADLETILAGVKGSELSEEKEEGEGEGETETVGDGVELKAGSADELAALTAAKVFTGCLLDSVGGGLIGDFCAVVERHRDGFLLVSSSSAAKLVVVRTIRSFWNKHPQMATLSLERLLRYKVINVTSIVAWTFLDGAAARFEKESVWGCFFESLDYITRDEVEIGSRINLLQARVAARAATEAEAEAEAADGADSDNEELEYLEGRKTPVKESVDEALKLVFQNFTAFCAANRPVGDAIPEVAYTIGVGRFRETARRYALSLWRHELLDSIEAEAVRCAFFDRNPRSRMSLVPTPEASRRVTNGIPLGPPLFLPVRTVNCVQTLKAPTDFETVAVLRESRALAHLSLA
jgi:hypothetical protein